MEATFNDRGTELVMALTGSLGFNDSKEWRRLTHEMLDTDAQSHVLDLTSLAGLDSSGLGMLLAMQQWAEDKNRDLKIIFEESSTVGSTLQLAKFDSMFEVIRR